MSLRNPSPLLYQGPEKLQSLLFYVLKCLLIVMAKAKFVNLSKRNNKCYMPHGISANNLTFLFFYIKQHKINKTKYKTIRPLIFSEKKK